MGHSAALKSVPFYQLILSQKDILEQLSKDELLHLIAGYTIGQVEFESLLDKGIELTNNEH